MSEEVRKLLKQAAELIEHLEKYELDVECKDPLTNIMLDSWHKRTINHFRFRGPAESNSMWPFPKTEYVWAGRTPSGAPVVLRRRRGWFSERFSLKMFINPDPESPFEWRDSQGKKGELGDWAPHQRFFEAREAAGQVYEGVKPGECMGWDK